MGVSLGFGLSGEECQICTYLCFLVGFSAGLVVALLTFLLPAWPDFWSFLGSAILAGGLGEGGVFSSVGLGCCRAAKCFPSFFKVVSHVSTVLVQSGNFTAQAACIEG